MTRLIPTAALLTACLAVTSCTSASSEDDDEPVGESGDAIVSERQLVGNELPNKTLSLTFDDGPGPRTVELADYLAANNIKATFFINGKNVPGRQSALDAIIGGGHLLANHTQNHLQLTKLSSANAIKEIADTDAIIARAQPSGPWIIRAPFGAWNGSVARAVNGTAMKKYLGSVFWDIGGDLTATTAADWACWGKGVSIDRCGELYLNEIHANRRGIVLMHDVHNKTVDMVKVILPRLIAEGYTFAPLGDVPSIRRALGSAATTTTTTTNNDDQGCASATLGHEVPENACVQSARDQKWSRCVGGEWIGSTGASDAHCASRFPLP